MNAKKSKKSRSTIPPKVTVRLKPHLREFLTSKLKEEANFSSRKRIIGAILEPLVELMPKDAKPLSKHKDNFTLTLPINFAGINTRHHSVYISEENQKIFARIISLYFKEIFFNYMDDKVRYYEEIQQCIFMFCSDYNLTYSHINVESLKKAYYRYRKKKSPKLSLISPLLILLCPYIFQTP